MKRFGLLGKDIEYSKSPKLHQVIAHFLNLNITYDLYDVDSMSIGDIIHLLKIGELEGLNVTKPYKEEVIDYLDELTPIAASIQAVNTIYIKDGKLIGDNTDYAGFKGMCALNHIEFIEPVYILGTGGSAKMIAYYLKELGIPYHNVSRQKDEKNITYQDINEGVGTLIQATPNGLLESDVPLVLKIQSKDKLTIDLLYHIDETKLMKASKEAINGLDMLIIQAIEAEKRWHNIEFSVTTEWIEKIKGLI